MRRIFCLVIIVLSALACPSADAGCLLLLHVGKCSASGPPPIITPGIAPVAGSYFNQNATNGWTNNALKPNGGADTGAVESLGFPSPTTNSLVIYVEGSINSALEYSSFESEAMLGAGTSAASLALSANSLGQPAFFAQRSDGGAILGSQWWNAVSSNTLNGSFTAGAGTNYATGFYPFTATGGGCAREPSGVRLPNGSVLSVDPGFLCGTTPTVSVASIPGAGAQQATGLAASLAATTCVSNSPVSGEMKVTAQVTAAHGIAPGQTFTLQGFTGSGFTGYNATYIALVGTTGSTLVGETATGGGTCPTSPLDTSGHEGTALLGVNGSIGLIPISTTNPFGTGATGITSKNGQHFCGIIGEYGPDSTFPGAQFASFVDDRGNALPGAPALVPWLNQGTANFTGYVSFGAQSTAIASVTSISGGTMTISASTTINAGASIVSTAAGFPTSVVVNTTATGTSFSVTASGSFSGAAASTALLPAMTVTAMNSYTLDATNPPTFNATTGFVTFTTTASPGFIPGSEFTVSSVSPSGYNKTYVAVAGTSGTTLVGNPLSGPVGTPSAISNPGSYVSGGALVSVIMPNMQVLGAALGSTISPYGTFGSTGVGGVGTYGLVGNPVAGTLAATQPTTGSSTITVTGLPAPPLVVGAAISGAGIATGTLITSVPGTAAGVFGISLPTTAAVSGTLANAGTIGSSGAPVSIFASPNHYYSALANSGSGGGVTSVRTQAALGDFWTTIGSTGTVIGSGKSGWGGSMANVSMLWGAFPQSTGGAPSTTSLASLCKKTTDIQSFAAANSLTVHSLYRLNDLGIWGDSSAASFQGYITNTTGTNATLNVASTTFGGLTGAGTVNICGPGVAGSPLACPTTSLGAGPTYALSPNTTPALGSIGAPVAMSAGAFKPATPLATSSFNGYIDGDGTSGHPPTLHVTSLPTTGNAAFTGVLGNVFTGHIDNGTIGTAGNLLTVTTTPLLGYSFIGVGTVITGGALSSPMTVTSLGTGVGLSGTYNLSGTAQTVPASTALFGSGILPAAANNIQVSSLTGTIAAGMLLTDGGVNIATATPILVNSLSTPTGGAVNWTINPTYYPPNITYSGLTGTLSTIIPGQYVQGATASVGLTNPVSIIGYGTGAGGVGTYLLSNAASNGIGNLGSPVAFISTGIGDAGAVAPGPALTIRDLGPGVAFPVTDYSAGTGTLTLDGTFDTSVLGGTPSTIQAQVSLTSGGPPVTGCSACAWTNLSGYSATLRSGTIFDWKGQALHVPGAAGPVFVSVRAANGTAYATMPSLIKVGLVFDWQGEGQAGALASTESGVAISSFVGFWGTNQWFNAPYALDQGPPVVGSWGPGQTIMAAGDRFGVLGDGVPFPEGVGVYEQQLTNTFGWPTVMINTARDGIGITPETMGGVAQSQTVGVGDGSTTTWCSASKFCASAGVSGAGPLYFTGAYQTGATLAGASVSGTTLSIPVGNQTTSTPNTSGIVLGALAPGFVLNTGPVLSNCLTGCSIAAYQRTYSATVSAAQTWSLICSGSCPTTTPTRADPVGGAPWPAYNIQGATPLASGFVNGGFGTQLVQAGTFNITVNGTLVCQDSSVFAYNAQGGNCTGAGITSSFVNYATGDYAITWTSAPTGPIVASWTNILSPDANQTPTLNRPVGFDFFGNGAATSGPMSSILAKTPGGVSGHVFGGGSSDGGTISIPGYQFGAPGYTQAVSWLYGTRFPTLIPGQSASTPFISANIWRAEGPVGFNAVAGGGAVESAVLLSQWSVDVAVKSNFTGTIASGVLTLTASASTPMWEGEVVDCVSVGGGCPLSQSSGVYITGLDASSPAGWGASGSKYDLGGAGSTAITNQPMQNAVYYTGAGPAFWSGPMNDVPVQASTLAATSGIAPHMADGAFAGRRVGARWAALQWGGLTNAANASDPTIDRVKANASGCDSAALAGPCLDVGNTFAAIHSATMVSSSATITVTGGISANQRPFAVGQALSCSGCTTGRFITSVSAPPSQSTGGLGQVGTTFTITANGTMGVSATETLTAGCSGTSGTGSNCIDIAFKAGTTNGTYGTSWALATCGENNLNGTAPPYQPPSGICQTNGIGSLVRAFRIGTTQAMWGVPAPTGTTPGSPYDDGADPLNNGAFNQSAAFTCNIVAAKVVQCVKGALYDATAHTLTSIGQWGSYTGPGTGTFVSYGDALLGTGRIASLQGYVGGQPFPLTAGSGGSPSSTVVQGAGCTTATGFVLPKMDVTIAGGALVNAYPSSETATQAMGLVIGGGCTFTPASGSGTITTPPTAPSDGVGGIATYGTDSNMMGDLLYGNEGILGNPLNSFFTNNFGGYFEPGLPVIPFGGFMGAQVSG